MITNSLAANGAAAVKNAVVPQNKQNAQNAQNAQSSQTTQTLTVAKATFASSEVVSQGATSNEVVNISKSMESLLDTFTGAATSAATGAAQKKAQQNGGSPPKGGFQSANLDRAREAENIMNKVATTRDAFAESLGKALKGLEGSLGGVLEMLGAPKDQIDGALKDFSKDLLEKSKSFDFSQIAVDYQSSATQFTIESSGIDLIVQDGDRQLKISYAKSTLDLRREDESLQAQVNSDGEGMVRVGQSSTTADGKAEGMIINAKGFSAEEVEQILGKLNEMSDKSGVKSGGLAVATPEKRQDGTMKLKLDLSAILPPMSETQAGAAAAASQQAAASGGLNITA
ncbi:MAG TPA: hypothetical protein PKZ97_08035 [Azospirillaceae bacterium]|nr:hypothetical protein [Azospirillaceae bacterium]HRQ81053.1 hypothetical protein [Azospirillaceae bacterium]